MHASSTMDWRSRVFLTLEHRDSPCVCVCVCERVCVYVCVCIYIYFQYIFIYIKCIYFKKNIRKQLKYLR